jgi:glyoxylase-like metal-dependent hydrolase (beta-lactamase superfamily II)
MIKGFTFNPFQENTYLLSAPNRDTILIDPGCYTLSEEEILYEYIQSHELNPVLLLLTHAHLDHILGNHWAHHALGLRPQMHALDLPDLQRLEAYAPLFGVQAKASPDPEKFLNHGERIQWAGPEIQVMQAPGHSPGSLCFYVPELHCIISGDVLFEGSIGRTDLPGGDYTTLIHSILSVLMPLPEMTTIYPGHGSATTIARERENNPFLKGT